MKRRKPIKRSNPKRAKRLHERNFGHKALWIRKLPCCLCLSADQVQAHHAKSRGAGGTSKDLVPLCWRCHEYGHRMGWKTVEKLTGIYLEYTAALLEREYQIECRTLDRESELRGMFERISSRL